MDDATSAPVSPHLASIPGPREVIESVPNPEAATEPSELLACRPFHRVLCARVPIAAHSPSDAVDHVLVLARRGRGLDVHLCNAYTLALADRDRGYRDLLRAAGLNLADGKSIAWVNKIAGMVDDDADRVRGADLFLDVVDRGRVSRLRHFLLGGSPEVVAKLGEELTARYPGAEIVGTESPPYRSLSEDERAEQRARIAACEPDIVWVGLGTPKQDHAVAELARHLDVVAVAVGAAFDFIAGNKAEAPRWMQESGLEWLHRLGSEPRRLWKRYLFGNSRFVYAAFRYRHLQCTLVT